MWWILIWDWNVGYYNCRVPGCSRLHGFECEKAAWSVLSATELCKYDFIFLGSLGLLVSPEYIIDDNVSAAAGRNLPPNWTVWFSFTPQLSDKLAHRKSLEVRRSGSKLRGNFLIIFLFKIQMKLKAKSGKILLNSINRKTNVLLLRWLYLMCFWAELSPTAPWLLSWTLTLVCLKAVHVNHKDEPHWSKNLFSL